MIGILTRIAETEIKILWTNDMSVTYHYVEKEAFYDWTCVSEDTFNHIVAMKYSLLLLDLKARKEVIRALIAEQQAEDKPNG